MYGIPYALVFEHVASPATAAFDAFEYTAPADASVMIESIFLGQITDFGDAQAECVAIQLIKGYTVSGSVGGTAIVNPRESGFAAPGGTGEVMNTTVANTGTPLIVHVGTWNVALEWQWRPTPEERLILSPSQRLVVRVGAHADAFTIGGTFNFRELGG